MKDAYYFPHDSNASRDPKLAALRSKFGFEGVGIWWTLVELMHEQKDGKFEKFPGLTAGLAFQLSIDEAMLKQIIFASINEFYLLQEDDKYIWSKRVQGNLVERLNKRMKRVEAGRLGGLSSGEKRSKMKQNEATLEANEPKESKGKERKDKKRFEKPTAQQVAEYAKSILYNVDGQSFLDFYESKGWLIGKSPMKDWKAAVRNWKARNQKEATTQGGVNPWD
jgi:hypothetical protein